jgi:hypothetical protein
MTILKLSFVASNAPSAAPRIIPADILRDASQWRVTADAYELILVRLVECEELAKGGAQTFVLSADWK